ncbi:MAG: hypothetical protein CBARDMAM_3851 [uncultured Caballeronia sp.]|nr:MAG: hypothetical protein CBARDMAM_3851 [uncultured Caballeronia sp.]
MHRTDGIRIHVDSNTSYQAIDGQSALPEGAAQRLIFSSPDGNPLFDYRATVQKGGREK